MLSKDNKDLVQIQQGNLEVEGFPEAAEEKFAQQNLIQSGKKGAKADEAPAMGSGFRHGIFEKD